MKRTTYLIFLITMACGSVEKTDLQAVTIPGRLIEMGDPSLSTKTAILYKADSLFSGFLVTYHPNRSMASKTGYLNGKRQGESVQYYESGQLKETRYYNKNRKSGHHEGFWPDGTRKFEYFFENGIHEGTLKEWYQSGDMFRFFNYTAGKENGTQKMWDSDGSIRANYVVNAGHRYGLIGLKNCKSITNEEGLYTAIAY